MAGSLLSYFLIRNGRRVIVYDHTEQPKASNAAAGIFNPFTGRKLVKTWMADDLFPFLVDFYHKLEQDLEIKVMHKMPMYRPFLTLQEQNDWGAKIHDLAYSQYIDSIVGPEERISEVANPLGGMMLQQCGFVDIGALIEGVKRYLIQNNSLQQQPLSIKDLELEQDYVVYGQHRAARIVFCEGPWLEMNHYFNWLPLRPVKGEILEVELRDPLSFIVNRGIFILPVNGRISLVGATFDHQNLDWSITEAARDQLEVKLKKLLKIPYKIIGQRAGIRPASADRRPLIGIHPEFEPLAVFNGLGTKGVSLAPYLIYRFFEFIEKGEPLIPEVSISRYFSLYYSKN